jgi:hypothetical protein
MRTWVVILVVTFATLARAEDPKAGGVDPDVMKAAAERLAQKAGNGTAAELGRLRKENADLRAELERAKAAIAELQKKIPKEVTAGKLSIGITLPQARAAMGENGDTESESADQLVVVFREPNPEGGASFRKVWATFRGGKLDSLTYGDWDNRFAPSKPPLPKAGSPVRPSTPMKRNDY